MIWIMGAVLAWALYSRFYWRRTAQDAFDRIERQREVNDYEKK